MEIKPKVILIALCVVIVIIIGTNIWTGISLRRSRHDYVKLEQSYSELETTNIKLAGLYSELEEEHIRARRIIDSASGDIEEIERDLSSTGDSISAIEIGINGLYRIIRTIKESQYGASNDSSS